MSSDIMTEQELLEVEDRLNNPLIPKKARDKVQQLVDNVRELKEFKIELQTLKDLWYTRTGFTDAPTTTDK